MDIPEDVIRVVESVFESHDGGDTVGYMAAAIIEDRKEQGAWKATLRYCEGQWSDERGCMLDQIHALRKVLDALVHALQNMVDADELTKDDYDQARAALALASK